MITDNTVKLVNSMRTCLEGNLEDELLKYADSSMSYQIAEELLSDDELMQNSYGLTYDEALKYFIGFCSYIENETDFPSVISDETFDKLVERYIDRGNTQPIGSIYGGDNKDKLPHMYPELRGSLPKIHFIYEKDIPKGDNRKSLEGYLKNVVRQLKDNNIPIGKVRLSTDLKYDGVSHILECHSNSIDTILTRGDVENNLGKDLTPVFKKFFPELNDKGSIRLGPVTTTMTLNKIPGSLYNENIDNEFGIKVETFMKTFAYDGYKEYVKLKRCNRRSAVTSICNQSVDNIEVDSPLKKFLSMQHFQISSKNKIDFEDVEDYWVYIGKFNDRYQYLYVENIEEFSLTNIPSICEHCATMIDALKQIASCVYVPIDGIVISLLDEDIVKCLGRRNDKNMFQVAFKFPAGIEKTTIESVDFQVGPVSGFITPVAKVEPVKINGNTITSVSLCNKAKMDKLEIHEGDEVIISYDIIPTIYKDSTCKCSKKPLIEYPTKCPICDGDIVDERCSNPDCSAKLVGHILNFISKNRISNIGYETIVDFVNAGYLNSIGDLFRLYRHREDLYRLPGYGITSIDNIIKSISDNKKLLPHQVFGAIGIPGIGFNKMEKVCRNLNIVGNINSLDKLYDEMIKISGIGSKTANDIINGINSKMDVILDICENVEFISYDDVSKKVKGVFCFTNVRDRDFEKYLERKGYKISDSLTNKVTTLIIPDYKMAKTSSKLNKAKERGIRIITLSDAMKETKYEPKG